MRPVRTVVGLLAAAATIFLVRDATITREEPVDPETALDVELRIHTRSDTDPEELADILFSLCQLEVDASTTEGPVPQGDDVFSFRLSPTLDESDRRQLEGCLEDARVDHVQGDLVSLRDVR